MINLIMITIAVDWCNSASKIGFFLKNFSSLYYESYICIAKKFCFLDFALNHVDMYIIFYILSKTESNCFYPRNSDGFLFHEFYW